MSKDRVPRWAETNNVQDEELLTVDWAESLESRLAMLEERIPETRLVEKSIVTRSVAVVGHEALGLVILLTPVLFLLLVLAILENLGIISLF
jgi:hypothetical protein